MGEADWGKDAGAEEGDWLRTDIILKLVGPRVGEGEGQGAEAYILEPWTGRTRNLYAHPGLIDNKRASGWGKTQRCPSRPRGRIRNTQGNATHQIIHRNTQFRLKTG
jgi:hypothetical protein